MTNTLTRRAALAGTMAAAIAPTAKADADTNEIDAKLKAMGETINSGEIAAVQITGNNFAPFYLDGEVVLTRKGDHRPASHVVLRLKTGKQQIVELVHSDAKSAYVRGLKAGDRMQIHPFKAIKSIDRIVATWRG